MYQLRATLYQLVDRDRVYGELWQSHGDPHQPLATAHLDIERDGLPTLHYHPDIMANIVKVCLEIAENLDESLF